MMDYNRISGDKYMKTQIQGSHQTQKMIFLFLLCYILLSLFAIHAEAVTIASGTCGDNLTWKLDSGKLTISGTGAMTDYDSASYPWYYKKSSIIKVVIENNVTSIGDSAFSGYDQLTSITIPNSVTKIGYGAFSDCYKLTNITIPNGVTSIGNSAFFNCFNLASITIPNSVTSIGDNAFSSCSNLTSITIPNRVTRIGVCSFSGCSNLTSITIPNSVTSIGEEAFGHCSGLTNIIVDSGNKFYCSVNGVLLEKLNNTDKNLICYPAGKTDNAYTIPNNVTSIGYYAFAGCSNLTSITIPNNVTSIGYGAFSNCYKLTNITIPNSVTSISDYTFMYCLNLTSITIPNNVTSIGKGAFYYCRNLTSITIPNNVTSIGNVTFYDCRNLTSITIPNSVTRIDMGAFDSCYNLKVARYKGTSEQKARIVIGSTNTPLTEAKWIYDDSDILTLPANLKEIGSEAFSGLTAVEAVRIPPNVFFIADDAFNDSNVIILAPKGSYAATWASHHGITMIEE